MKTHILSPGTSFIAPTRRTAGPHASVVDLFRDNNPALVVCTDCGATWDEGGTYPPACKRKVTPAQRRAQLARRAASINAQSDASARIVAAAKAWHAGDAPSDEIWSAVDYLQRAEKAVDDINNEIERSTAT